MAAQQYPCSNPKCPNKWHQVPECPNSPQTRYNTQRGPNFNSSESVKMAGADKYGDIRMGIRNAFGEVVDGSKKQAMMVGDWFDYGHQYPNRVGVARRVTGLLYLVTSRTVRIGWHLGKGAGRAVNSFFRTPAEKYNEQSDGPDFSGQYDPETGDVEFDFSQPIGEEEAVDPDAIQEEEAAYRSNPETPAVDEMIYNLYLKNFSEENTRSQLRGEGYDEQIVDEALSYISRFKQVYEEQMRRAREPRENQGTFVM